MNKVVLIGRLTKDVNIENTANGTKYTRLTVACKRKVKNENGEYESDFISCIAWKSNAEFINKYFKKGSEIALCGTLQTRSYEDDKGIKRYIAEVVVAEVDFVGTPKKEEPKDDLQPLDTNEKLPF